LKSIEHHLKSQDYPRLRIGVGPEEGRERGTILSDYVLGDFGKRDAEVVRGLLPELAEAMEVWVKEGITPAMNRFTGH
jgi:PTH1 family peptidyl-tRNA hydrolase